MNKLFLRIFKPLVVFFLFNFILITPALALKPDDPDYFLQWYIDKINLPQAWDYTQGSSQVVVAVLDTGVDATHPDLADNIWINKDEIPGDGIDNDRNGYIDDVHGWNFTDNNANSAPDFSLPYEASAITHGTLIAGLIGAAGNNLRGIAGVAWKVKIMPVRVLDNYGEGEAEMTVKGMRYAIDQGADVINLSFQGSFPNPKFQEVLAEARHQGIMVVSAAGNGNAFIEGYNLDKAQFFPVCYRATSSDDLALGVASTNKDDERSIFSNYGRNCVDVSAPGERIYSTQSYRGPNTDLDAYYSGWWQGTSLSAPIVAGVAALIKSLSKGFTPDLISQFITTTADSIDYFNPYYIGKLGAGRVNAGRAVKAAFDYLGTHPDLAKNLPVILSRFYVANGLVVTASASHRPEVSIFNSQNQLEKNFLAYSDKFLGGVNIAAADLNNDRRSEIITGAGPGGGPEVRVFNQGGDVLSKFMAEDKNFRGGINVAAGDVDGDKEIEIVTAAQSNGGPAVKVFDQNGKLEYQFLAYDKNFRGGINVAAGDVNLDGTAEIVVVPAKGNISQVKFFNYQGRLLNQFLAYDKNFRGGVNLALGDVDGDYRPEIITAPQSGLGPHLKVFSQEGNLKSEFFPFYEYYYGGVKLAAGDYNGDGFDELIAAQAGGDPLIKVLNSHGQEQAKFYGFSQGYTGGVNVAIIK